MTTFVSLLTLLLWAALLIVAVLLLLAPGEIVSLAAGWHRRATTLPDSLPYFHDVKGPGRGSYLVYLDGIGKSAPRDTRVARDLIAHLDGVLPGTRFVGHVTPYSPFNRALDAHPRLGAWWRLALRRFRWLVFLRNVAQTLVVCDRRYQRTYIAAIADTVLEHLRASGYREGSGTPVVLIGYSGGAEVAVGIAPRIAEALRTPPISVVSIGGFLEIRSPMVHVGHLYHFRSRNDWIERAGAVLFPSRWPFLRNSGWNTGRRSGRITEHRLDGARHFGRRGYLSALPTRDGGESRLARTLNTVAAVVAENPPSTVRGTTGPTETGKRSGAVT